MLIRRVARFLAEPAHRPDRDDEDCSIALNSEGVAEAQGMVKPARQSLSSLDRPARPLSGYPKAERGMSQIA